MYQKCVSLFFSSLTQFSVFICLALLSHSKIIHDWSFNKAAISGETFATDGKLQKPAKFDTDGLLIFSEGQQIHFPDSYAEKLPKTFSIEAFVRIDKPDRWGGIIGFTQDNGNYEKGWLLGYNGSNYSLKGSVNSTLIEARNADSFSVGQWAHVASVIDGKTLKLYVDGQLVQSTPLSGNIAYPDIATQLVIGAYRDKDENFPMEGRIGFIKIHDSALTDVEMKKLGGGRRYEFAVRPKVEFTSPSQAIVSWEATQAGAGAVAYGLDKQFKNIAKSDSNSTTHTIILDNLEPASNYYYRLAGEIDGKRKFSPIYEFTTTMNMSLPVLTDQGYAGAEIAKKISALNKQQGGICLVIGLKDGELAYEIARHTKYKVICIEKDPSLINSIRNKLYKTGFYGSRISVLEVDDMNKIPLTASGANIVTTERESLPVSTSLAYDLLSANSKLVTISGKKITTKTKTVKETNDWNHQYGTAASTSNSGEQLKGATKVTDLQVQWFGRPGGDFGIDRAPRMPAPLAANGRLFHQGQDRMVALDSHNGQVLWSLEVPDLRRVNIPRDCSNWCADQENLYVAIKDRAWKIDAATGEQVDTLRLTKQVRGTHDWGYIGNADGILVGSSVKSGAHFTEFWGGKMWYDGSGDRNAIAQVVSDNIFAYNIDDSKGLWAYGKGVIINSTITIGDGSIFFLENRSPDLKRESNGKIASNSLWTENLFAVCLNLKTGSKRWENPFPVLKYVTPSTSHVQVGYGTYVDGKFIPVISQAKNGTSTGFYTYHCFDAKNGKLKWEAETQWRANHHGAHMQHPVITGNKMYCDPGGVSLKTGTVLDHKYGPRAACAAAVATDSTIFFRGLGGGVTMWDTKQKNSTFWKRLRPSCWLNYIPSNGMFLVPEGGAGCSCGGWMETSLGYTPVK